MTSSRADSEPLYNITPSGRRRNKDYSNNSSHNSMTRPLLTGSDRNTSSRSTLSGGSGGSHNHINNKAALLGRSRSGHSGARSAGRSTAGYTTTSTTPLAPARRKKQIVYPPSNDHSIQSIVTEEDETEFSELLHNHHPMDDGSHQGDALDISRMAQDRPMMMREAMPERPIFPSEEAANSTGDVVNEFKTPEVVMAPAQGRSMGQQLMSDEDLDAVGDFIIKGSTAGFCLWLFLVINVYVLAPADSYEWLDGMERQATWTLVILLFATNTTRIIPLVFQKNGFQFMQSGIVVGAFTVQFIALVSNILSVCFPSPVMIDPMTGMRIHLMRFATWTPLCFLMTFLTEAIDLNWQSKASVHQSFQQHSFQVAWWHAAFMALSTICGALFPYCKNRFVWWETMTISWLFYITIYLRLYQRYNRYKFLLEQQQSQMPNKTRQTRGPNFLLNEAVDRARMSFQLIILCSVTWTLIAGNFTLCCFLPQWFPKDSLWGNPELQYVIGTMLEAVSKVYYLTMQLHVYDKVFDESSRSARRLEEMRTLMSALWEASTDILVICAETDAFIHAVISPHPLLQSEVEMEELCDGGRSHSSTMLEVSKKDNTFVSFPMNLSEPVTREAAQRIQNFRQKHRQLNMDFNERDTARGKNLAALAKLAKRACHDEAAWHNHGANWSLQEMLEYDPNTEQDIPVTCEARVTAIDSGGVLLVLRDVSERYQRFEVEKALLEEVIVRKKDAEAIRFTRHEVKNGLLAAIGIVDGLKEQMTRTSAAEGDPDAHMEDLDIALKEILEAILDNAMIREVVYEGYVPRRETVDLAALLDGKRAASGDNGSTGSNRFPLFSTPDPFPHLLLDPQLIRKIYQNAVSNACKYGKRGGDVKTFLTYDAGSHIFRMEVFNHPGYNHDALLHLGDNEMDGVFQESTQLEVNQDMDTKEGRLASARSAGDGAWIMQKCAQCLGGDCEISYTPRGTTLTFECPATVSSDWKKTHSSSASVSEAFAIPPSTWAIAVEDSPMQQKLLARFLKQSDFPDERVRILGKKAEELYNFTDIIQNLMMDNPKDKFILIIDENLDIVEGGTVTQTVSGSFSIHQLRKTLPAADEERMLALIRSANDSVQEVEMYQSRAHGFLLKGPMKKGGLVEEIKPWWIRRFNGGSSRKSRRRKKSTELPVRSLSGSGRLMFGELDASESNSNDDWIQTKERIKEFVGSIDSLTYGHGSDNISGESDWQPIRYKLLLLNIDLKINASSRDLLALASKSVDELTSRGGDEGAPDGLLNKWLEIRELVNKGLEEK